MCQQGKWEKSSKTAHNNKRAHANTWTSSHSSMSPSMSSTGCEQLGWELLGGAAERVTRFVSGTKAPHSCNNGNACCVARSASSRRLLLPATFTPSTSRQFNNAPLTNHAACHSALPSPISPASCPHHAPYLACVVGPIRLHYCSPPHHRHHLQHSPPRSLKEAGLRKSMHGTPDMYCTRWEPPSCMWDTPYLCEK